MQGRQDRLTYYQNMLVDSGKQGGTAAASSQAQATTKGGKGTSMSKPKSGSTAVRSSIVASTIDHDSVTGAGALGMTTGAAGFGRGGRGMMQTAFNMYLNSH